MFHYKTFPLCLALSGFVFGALSGAAMAQDQRGPWWAGVYGEAQAQAWSNGIPVLDINGPWSRGYEARSGEQRAYQSFRGEVGVQVDPGVPGLPGVWRVGVLTRADALVQLSGEAAQLAYHYQSQTDPAQPGSYDSASRSLSWKGTGVAVSTPPVEVGPLRMDVGLQWFRLSRLRSTDTQGLTTYNGGGSYDYALSLRDDHDRERAPAIAGLAAPDKHGTGAALSLGLRWDPTQALSLSLRVDDLWSRLRWAGIHGDDAVLNSEVATRTPEGYIDYQPAVQGQYTRRTLSERIPTTVEAQGVWHRPEGDWSLRLHRRWGLQQAWLGWQSTGEVRWLAAVEPRFGAVQLGVEWAGLRASVMADSLDDAAHVRSVGVSYLWRR